MTFGASSVLVHEVCGWGVTVQGECVAGIAQWHSASTELIVSWTLRSTVFVYRPSSDFICTVLQDQLGFRVSVGASAAIDHSIRPNCLAAWLPGWLAGWLRLLARISEGRTRVCGVRAMRSRCLATLGYNNKPDLR